jgi:hypothetical protein
MKTLGRTFVLGLLFLLLMPIAMADTVREWSAGAGVTADPNGEYTGAIVTGKWFPTTRELNWGVHTYGMLARYDHHNGSGASAVAGAAPVLTWRGFYAGIGAAVNNTTPHLGTPINFSTIVGYDYQINDRWSVEGNVLHLSHGASLGIAEDKPNGGVTTLGLQAIYRF